MSRVSSQDIEYHFQQQFNVIIPTEMAHSRHSYAQWSGLEREPNDREENFADKQSHLAREWRLREVDCTLLVTCEQAEEAEILLYGEPDVIFTTQTHVGYLGVFFLSWRVGGLESLFGNHCFSDINSFCVE